MKKVGLILIVIACTTQVAAHDASLTYDCNQLEGNWSVFCPKGTTNKSSDCKIEDDAEVLIAPGSASGRLSISLTGSKWKVEDGTEVACIGGNPIVAVPVHKGGQDKLLCIQRITSIFDLGRRNGQVVPNMRQVGMSISNTEEECTWSARVNPGHSHADD
jgi:hypothetical protein